MNSPLSKVILATFGGYLIILLFLSAYDWISKEYPKRPNPPLNPAGIQHPIHYKKAVSALKLFFQLPEPERAAIKENLETNLMCMEQWLKHLAQFEFKIMCVGELHEETTRDFLAEEFFAKIRTDTLLVEATPKLLKGLIKRMESGRDYYPLLDADIIRILRAAMNANPAVNIYGIEETDEQQNEQGDFFNLRDRSIASNFWDCYQPGKSHIILFGALHCTNDSNWLFQNLRQQASFPLKKQMLNMKVLGEHQDGPLEGFVYFLDEIGIERKRFVIRDTSSLHPRVCELFPLLQRQTLDKYQAVIVFRP